MLTDKELVQIATSEIIAIFGKKYLQDNYKGSCITHGMVNADTFQFFVGLKGKTDLPNRKADNHGWVVFGKVLLDAITGKVKEIEYVLE